jgi:hypothetical protein
MDIKMDIQITFNYILFYSGIIKIYKPLGKGLLRPEIFFSRLLRVGNAYLNVKALKTVRYKRRFKYTF